MSSNIRNVLDISTGHLKPRDVVILNSIYEMTDQPFRVHEYQNGFVVAVGTMNGDTEHAISRMKKIGLSDEFVNLMKHAQANDAMLIQFDTDADYEPGFPIYDHVTGEDITADYMEDEQAAPGM